MNDEKRLEQARERFRYVKEWESEARTRMLDDVRFGNASSADMWQWPQEIYNNRIVSDKPCLTMNRVRQYCLQIINDSRQNKPSIKINPTGGGASFDSAQVYESVIRHIEYASNAQQAYDAASWWQVYGGLGWWRVTTEYEDDGFEQTIRIKRIADAMSVYMDPNITEYDGSDAKWAFVFRDMDADQFDKEYPRYANRVSDTLTALPDEDSSGWYSHSQRRIRLAEYFYKEDESDTLHALPDGTMVKESDVDPAMRPQLQAMAVRSREITSARIGWCLIAGSKIVEKGVWPGKYIPLVRVVGEELVIDKKLDRRGHVRALTDAQRSMNYYASAGIEYVALQSKTPYIAPLAAIEGYETEWKNANISNLAILPYNHIGDDGGEIPRPAREPPPVYADAYLKGITVAQNEMAMVSGQFEATLGEPSNERSGRAINERQRAALNATYHYVDHLATAIRFTGKILIDLIPKIYDTQRIVKIVAEDGTQQTVAVDPNSPVAHQPMPALDSESLDRQHIAAIFNPLVGQYSVQADVGPAYQTRRLESFQALSDIMSQNEAVAPLVMDIWAKSSDFPLADVLAERFRNMLPPQALGQGPSQQEQQMQQQIKALQDTIVAQQHEMEKMKTEKLAKAGQTEIDFYEAETKRLAAVGQIDPLALRPVVRQLVSEVLGTPINPIIAAHVADEVAMHHSQGVQHPDAAPIPPPPTNGSEGASP